MAKSHCLKLGPFNEFRPRFQMPLSHAVLIRTVDSRRKDVIRRGRSHAVSAAPASEVPSRSAKVQELRRIIEVISNRSDYIGPVSLAAPQSP